MGAQGQEKLYLLQSLPYAVEVNFGLFSIIVRAFFIRSLVAKVRVYSMIISFLSMRVGGWLSFGVSICLYYNLFVAECQHIFLLFSDFFRKQIGGG